MNSLNIIEEKRQGIQLKLDSLKTRLERNKLGQFSTPIELSNSILSYTKHFFHKDSKITFLDPAIGTGSFYSALLKNFPLNKIDSATGYEIDLHYALESKELWRESKLDYRIDDFCKAEISSNEKYNLIVCNPPYVRHHHLNGQKKVLQENAVKSSNIKLSSLAGLYCYFVAISHKWLDSDGIGVWLIPSEFMDVNYGKEIKNYLLNKVELIQIHRFAPEDIQFTDALVSSAIVIIRNKKPTTDYQVNFSFGGNIETPLMSNSIKRSDLEKESKWTRFPQKNVRDSSNHSMLSDFFAIKRGIATGDNSFFILAKEEINRLNLPLEHFRPILPSPRYLKETEILSDENRNPIIEQKLFVLDCKLSLTEIEGRYPSLYSYIQTGIEKGVSNRYLCKNRKIWYAQENRESSSFYCTYIGRSNSKNKNTFRFILNHSDSIVSNSYLILNPKDKLKSFLSENIENKRLIYDALNSILDSQLLDEGRVYGGGMHKIEPRELSKVNADVIRNILK
ncbi:Eco57I restriction-modification methylase domain-containing protein [Labilibacter marinus]|uniref:Eco57I restriction-modification methylase domain-containing protein n=1 Tax=Labilibacter marinus TaxID=1477105 RepID=UPI00094FD386|nr:class I SAM-dependent methyltransferase [Labilibacter marinus]